MENFIFCAMLFNSLYCKRKLAIAIITDEIYHTKYVKMYLLKQIPCAQLCIFHVNTSQLNLIVQSSNRSTRENCKIYSKLTIKTPERHQ